MYAEKYVFLINELVCLRYHISPNDLNGFGYKQNELAHKLGVKKYGYRDRI